MTKPAVGVRARTLAIYDFTSELAHSCSSIGLEDLALLMRHATSRFQTESVHIRASESV